MPRPILSGKHRILATILILFLLLAVLFPHLAIMAQPARIPHENLSYAKNNIDATSILTFYGNVFSQATQKRYENASNMLEELKYANIPDEMRYIIDRYNKLSSQLIDMLNKTESLLKEASNLISQNQLDEARKKLNEAEEDINDARTAITDIELATNLLGETIGISSPQASDRLLKAYQRLKDLLAALQKLIDELSRMRQQLVDNPQPGNPQVKVIKEIASYYYQTTLEVSAPKEGRPGMSVTVAGNVTSTGDAIDRQISLLLDNTRMAGETTRSQFQFRMMVPPQTATGRHILTIVAAPVEHYAGASWSSPISITRIPIVIGMRVPLFNIMPKFQVTGKISADSAPLADALVTLNFKKSATTVKTAADGSFAVNLSAPLDLSLFGPEELVVSAEPKEPWYASGRMNRWILMANPANMGLMIIIFISLGVLVFKRSRTRPARQGGIINEPDAVPEPLSMMLEPKRRYEITSAHARIISAYHSSIGIVAKATGITPALSDTIREYARNIMPLIPAASQPFTELTGIVEIALYSSYQIDDQAIVRAESLARLIKESCSGTA